MRFDRTAWASAGAFVMIFAVTGCEIIAFSTGSTGSTGSGTSASSTSSSTSSGGTCVENISATCSQNCQMLCNAYLGLCVGTIPATMNAYGSPAACCELCNLLEKDNLVTCREKTPTDCAKAGPFGETANCGTDRAALYCGICGGPPPAVNDGSHDQAVVKAANDAALGATCSDAKTCNCDYALGKSTNSSCKTTQCE